MNYKLKTKNQTGSTAIALIVAITLSLLIIIVTIQAITLLSIRISKSDIGKQNAFYATEGLLYDTIARMNRSFNGNTYSWPGSNLNDSPNSLPGISFDRSITKTGNEYTIDITAKHPYAARRLTATLTENSSSLSENDIMLVIDTSGSMQYEGHRTCTEWNNAENPDPFSNCAPFGNKKIGQPIFTTQSAAEYFINLIANDPIANPITQTGVILYARTAKLQKPLNFDHLASISSLNGLNASGATNIDHALELARQELNPTTGNGRSTAKQTIVLLTDGIANMYHLGSTLDVACATLPTSDTNCTTAARLEADGIKNTDNIFLYTVGLGLSAPYGQYTQSNINFGQQFLREISNQPPAQYAYILPTRNNWNSNRELQNVYGQILNHIVSTPYLRIQEQVP